MLTPPVRDRHACTSGSSITAAGSPSASRLPKLMTSRRSATASNACTTCSIHTIVTPCSFTRWISSTSSCVSGSVRPPAISSSSSSFGRVASARASSSRLRSSSVSVPANWFARRSRPVRFKYVDAHVVSCAFGKRAAEGRAHQQVFEHRHAAERTRHLIRCGRCRRCSVDAARVRRYRRRRSRSLPASGRTSPLTRLKSVVLPAPFGPRMP